MGVLEKHPFLMDMNMSISEPAMDKGIPHDVSARLVAPKHPALLAWEAMSLRQCTSPQGRIWGGVTWAGHVLLSHPKCREIGEKNRECHNIKVQKQNWLTDQAITIQHQKPWRERIGRLRRQNGIENRGKWLKIAKTQTALNCPLLIPQFAKENHHL